MESMYLIPQPQKLQQQPGSFVLPHKGVILMDSRNLAFASERLQKICRETCGVQFARRLAGKAPCAAAFAFRKSEIPMDAQAYRLEISPAGVTLTYGGEAGALYAVSTLKQLLLQYRGALPCLYVEDAPDYPQRGVLYDISRDRMPNMETLYRFIDFMADVKLNQLFLYVEGLKFAYASYPQVWEGGSPLTGEEILLLDRYCRERCIELIPTQNCLGHMTKWLEREEFRGLAECEEGYPANWAPSGIEKPGTLAPYLEGTRTLVENMTDDFLPYFSSSRYNVCLDEPYELGMGKSRERCGEIGKDGVYLEYVLWLQQLARRYGKSLMMWGDVIKHYPDLFQSIPKDITILEWAYDPDSPFAKYGAEYQMAGIPYYVCPGTACWLSLIGRIDKMRKNQENAAENGLRFGAEGYLVTSWGDRGHWEHFPITLPGYLYGAALSWSCARSKGIDLAPGLDLLLFGDETGRAGRILIRLGELPNPLEQGNASLVASIFKDPVQSTDAVQKIADFDFAALRGEVAEILAELAASRMRGPEAETWKRELVNNARLFCHGCRMGELKQLLLRGETAQARKLAEELIWELEELIREYEQVWLLRNRLDGLWDSTENMRRILREYRELALS